MTPGLFYFFLFLLSLRRILFQIYLGLNGAPDADRYECDYCQSVNKRKRQWKSLRRLSFNEVCSLIGKQSNQSESQTNKLNVFHFEMDLWHLCLLHIFEFFLLFATKWPNKSEIYPMTWTLVFWADLFVSKSVGGKFRIFYAKINHQYICNVHSSWNVRTQKRFVPQVCFAKMFRCKVWVSTYDTIQFFLWINNTFTVHKSVSTHIKSYKRNGCDHESIYFPFLLLAI